VSRASARTRRVANEEALWQLLRARGFDRIAPERLTVAEQIRLFAEASLVVAPHGAAQTNTLFSTRLTLVELFSSDYLNPCNFALAEAASHEYWYVVGAAAQDGTFDAPLDLVDATVTAAVDGARVEART
jgi:capsular polysaccharide biosynthesis protein